MTSDLVRDVAIALAKIDGTYRQYDSLSLEARIEYERRASAIIQVVLSRLTTHICKDIDSLIDEESI